MWIKENKILLTTLFVSSVFHVLLFESGFYNNNKIMPPKIVSFEIIHPLKKGEKTETVSDTSIETAQTYQEIIKETQAVTKNTVKPQHIQKEPKKTEHKKDDRKTAAAGNAAYDNNAIIYEKENLEIIRNMIVNRIIYPPQAKKLGIEGSGYLIIIIDNSGKIISVSANGFPNRLLSEAALKAAKKVGQVAGHSLASVEMKIPINFHLR